MFALDIEEAIDYKITIPVMIYSTGRRCEFFSVNSDLL